MDKIKINKDGVTQFVKPRHLQNFVERGWKVSGDEKVSKVGKAKATADIIEEEVPLQIEEENWDEPEQESSMPNDIKGEE